MNAPFLDDDGIILDCGNCGRRNRIRYDRLDHSFRCGHCKTTIPGATRPVDIDSEEHFNSLLGLSSLPVLVDFWASWCGPCKMAAPEFDKVAAASAGELVVAKVNTDDLGSLAQRYDISSIPTMIVFRGGKEFARAVGAQPADAIHAFALQSADHIRA